MPHRNLKKSSETRNPIEILEKLGRCGIWNYFPHQNLFRFDSGAAELLGLGSSSELSSDELLRIIQQDDRDSFTEVFQTIPEEESFSFEVGLIPDPARKTRYIRFVGQATYEQSEEFTGIIQDISAGRKHLDEQIRAREKAENSDRMKSQFLANMSHELRGPMNSIIGFSELIYMGQLPPEKRKEYSRIIRIKGQQLLSLIDDIIEASRFESGTVQISSKTCDISILIRELYQTATEKQKIYAKENILIIPVVPQENYKIQTDPGRLLQIFNILIDNALKFTEKGRIEFGFDLKDQKSLLFFVRDTGIGLKKDELKNIFNRFYGVEETSSRRSAGTGIGLSLCKYIVQLLEGKIWAESIPEQGSTFWFSIPIQDVSQKDFGESGKEVEEDPSFNWKNKVILIVEDDDVNVQFLEAILDPFQVKILHAENGLQAIELCRSIPKIDLVLMDIKMPEMNGYEACKEILSFRPDLPIIAQTAFAMRDEMQKCYDAGCRDYVSKPIDIAELLSKIQNAMNA